MGRLRTLSKDFNWRLPDLSWPVTTDVGAGLSGVVAAASRVSWLDPESGLLTYRGIPIEEILFRYDLEQVSHLLITGKRPEEDPAAFRLFRDRLRNARQLPDEVIRLVEGLDRRIHPTLMLRAGLSALGCHELGCDDELEGARHWRELRIVGQVAAIASLAACHRAGRPYEPGELGESIAEGTLRALTGHPSEPTDVKALNLLWLLYAVHGLDAPTFTSMVVASCLADPYYNIVAGLSALRGPRLGGAGEAVLDLLLSISQQDAAGRVRALVEAGSKIPGFGHRIYRIPDPRAAILRKWTALHARRAGRPEVFAVARAVEDEAAKLLAGKGVHININFYAALLFHLLGAEPAMVPCLFVVGRMAGLTAAVRESLDTIRLFRPRLAYLEAE